MLPKEPFVSDGCTFFPDNIGDVDLTAICVEHDYAYWCGGTKEDRLAADIRLYERLCGEGLYITATIMYAGVRAGGGRYWPYSPMPKRKHWGYGWPQVDYGYGYGV